MNSNLNFFSTKIKFNYRLSLNYYTNKNYYYFYFIIIISLNQINFKKLI